MHGYTFSQQRDRGTIGVAQGYAMTRSLAILNVVVIGSTCLAQGLDVSAPERPNEFHFIEAEHASLSGAAQVSGTAVWIYSGALVRDRQ